MTNRQSVDGRLVASRIEAEACGAGAVYFGGRLAAVLLSYALLCGLVLAFTLI